MAIERVIVGSPLAAAGGRVIVSPFQFLTSGEDNLRIEGWNSVANVTLEVSYRFADTHGKITAEQQTVPLTADRTRTTRDFRLGEGYLINLAVFVTGAAPRIGQTFVCIKLIRGLSGATIVLGLLLQGYVGAEQGLGWPGSPIQHVDEGPGFVRAVVGTAPAAGAQISETVPFGARWELLGFQGAYIADGTPGARTLALAFQTDTTAIALVPQSVAVAPGATIGVYFNRGLNPPVGSIGTSIISGFPADLGLLAGWKLATGVVGGAAGDQWLAPLLTIREHLEVDA